LGRISFDSNDVNDLLGSKAWRLPCDSGWTTITVTLTEIPPPTLPPTQAPKISVVEGSEFCTVDKDECISDGVGPYSSNEKCKAVVAEAGVLVAEEFDLEPRL